jgi:hypothetical protein
VIDFDLTFPTALRFLERYSIIAECNAEVFYLSNYMLELSIIEVKMNKWDPSVLASSCIYISKKIKEIPKPWSALMTQQTKCTESQLQECAKDIIAVLNYAHLKKYYKSVFNKYSSAKYNHVANFCKNLCETRGNQQSARQGPPTSATNMDYAQAGESNK